MQRAQMACPVIQHLHFTQHQHSGARWDPVCPSPLDEAAERERHQVPSGEGPGPSGTRTMPGHSLGEGRPARAKAVPRVTLTIEAHTGCLSARSVPPATLRLLAEMQLQSH